MDVLTDIRTVFILAGILLIVAAIFGGGVEIREIKIPRLHGAMRLLSALVGVGFIAVGFLKTPADDHSNGDSGTFALTIDNLQDGTEVNSFFLVSGKASSLVPQGKTLWLLAQDADGDIYPLRSFILAQDRSWEEPVRLGPQWKGRYAYVMVASADGSQNPVLATAIDTGIKQFPEGVSLLARKRLYVK